MNNKTVVVVSIIAFVILAIIGNYNLEKIYGGTFSSAHLPKDIISQTEFLFYKEGKYSTVAVTKDPLEGATNLLINGKGQGSNALNDLRVNFLLSYLPLILNQEGESALVIGLGTGTTSGHLASSLPTTTVEIEQVILETTIYFDEINRNVLQNRNHSVIFDDARNYLLKNTKKYDIISQEPSDPWQSFSTSLYSREFFELVKEDLSEKGVFTNWVPIYTMTPKDFQNVYKTFHEVFPYVLVFVNINENENFPIPLKTSEIILVGTENPISVSDISKNFDSLDYYSKQHLKAIGIASSVDLENLFLFSEKDADAYIQNARIITDDNLILESSTGKRYISGEAMEVISDINKFLEKE
jgi:spermidine synthase